MSSPAPPPAPGNRFAWACGCALIGAVAAGLVTSFNEAYRTAPWEAAIVVAAGLGVGGAVGGVVGSQAHRLRGPRWFRGTALGLAAVATGHLFVLLALLALESARSPAPLGVGRFLSALLVFTAGSFLMVGWFTVPAGIVLGWWWVHRTGSSEKNALK